MSIGSISFFQQDQSFWNQSQSFYQQNQNYWNHQQAQDAVSTADASLSNSMGAAQTNLAKGLASIANQTALNRVNKEIADQIQKLESPSGGSSTSSSSTPSGPAPATATGTVPLTASTPLSTLGIPPNGVITVSDGTNTTQYSSTGTDTVTDLIGAINTNVLGNAYVTAALNSKGKLVITGKNDTEPVMIGGTFASDVGFGHGNTSFEPTAGSSSSSTSSAASSSSATSGTTASKSSSASTSKSASTKSSKSTATNAAPARQTGSTAASLLTASGVSGSLVDMLA